MSFIINIPSFYKKPFLEDSHLLYWVCKGSDHHACEIFLPSIA